MLLAPDIITILKANQAVLTSEYYIKRIGIFGSYAKRTQTPDSDIDFVVEFADDCQDLFDTKHQLRLYLSGLFNKQVDIANLKAIKQYAFNEIANHITYAGNRLILFHSHCGIIAGSLRVVLAMIPQC